MDPYSSKSCDTDGPCWPRRQYVFPRNRHVLVCSDNLVSNTFLNVTKFQLRYSGMRGRSVEGAEVPKHAPDETDATGCVEHDPPSEMGDDKRAQRVG